MILQTFSNPVWTVDTVGRVYLVAFILGGFLLYHLIDSLKITILDLIKIVRNWFNK